MHQLGNNLLPLWGHFIYILLLHIFLVAISILLLIIFIVIVRILCCVGLDLLRWHCPQS